MSKVLKTQSSGLGLTVADTFRETFDDEETGAAGHHFEDHPTSTAAAATSKPRYRWVLAGTGTAVLLVVLGVSVGLATRNNNNGSDAPSSASVAESPAAVPTVPAVPEAPGIPAAEAVAIKPTEDTAREPTTSANGGSFDPVPEVSVGDAALLSFGDAVAGTTGPSGSPVTDAPTRAPTDEPTASPSAAPSAPPSETPTHGPSASPTTSEPTKAPTPQPSSAPTSSPTNKPTFPDLSSWSGLDWGQFDPSAAPSKGPTSEPTSEPTNEPTSEPTTGAPTTEAPTASPTGPFFFGDEFDAYPDLGAGGLHVSTGLSIRLIARTGRPVPYANGGESDDDFHSRADAAGIIFECPETPTECGYAYVSNSEEGDGGGGVHAIYFDKDANILEYKSLLTKTTDNCGGGLTPWNTFVSCEEFSDGQCWQVDPYAERAEETRLGGNGGRYESVAVDNRNPNNPVFFTTEDDEFGALRRFVADGNGWECLHNDPVEERFLKIIDGDTFEWTTDEDEGRESAADHFPNTEGIQFHEGKLYFMAKKIQKMFILDVENMTYTTEGTGKKFYGEGSFGNQPDQNMFGPTRKYMYFTEDGGTKHGVYARYHDGTYFTLFEAMGDGPEDETVGIALSPDHRRLYAGIQDSGYIFEVTRDDGLPFE